MTSLDSQPFQLIIMHNNNNNKWLFLIDVPKVGFLFLTNQFAFESTWTVIVYINWMFLNGWCISMPLKNNKKIDIFIKPKQNPIKWKQCRTHHNRMNYLNGIEWLNIQVDTNEFTPKLETTTFTNVILWLAKKKKWSVFVQKIE